MKNIDVKKYIFKNKIKSILFIIKETKHGGIKDETKKVIRKIRNKVGNIRFMLLAEELKTVNEVFDLVITDDLKPLFVERIDYIVRFNHLLFIVKEGVVEAKYTNKFKTIEVPLTRTNDLNRIPELKRLRNKQTTKQLAGKKAGLYIGVASIAAILLLPSLVIRVQMSEYLPATVTALTVDNNKSQKVQFNTKYSALTYNTGFAAYNQNMHFFMDSLYQRIWGGQSWAESEKATYASLDGFRRVLANQDHDTDINQIIDSDQDVASYQLRGSRIYTTDYDVEGDINKRIEKSDQYVDDINYFNTNLNDNGDGQVQYINDAIINRNGIDYKWSDIYNTTFAINYSVPFIQIPINCYYNY